MQENNKPLVSTKHKLILGACVVVGTVGFVVANREKKAIVEAAREAGVNDWLREMHDNKLTVMVLTQELAEKMYTTANAAVGTADMFPVYAS